MAGKSARNRRARADRLARNFPENGIQMLLEHPGNVRELLALTGEALVAPIDLDRMRLVRGTFITRDYRRRATDVVLVAPFRRADPNRRLMISILIEHQSEPDLLMPLRMVDYVTQIYRFQERRWKRRHSGSILGLRLLPVLPVVFHTGTRPWNRLGTLTDLIQNGDRFRRVTPVMECLFVNLPAMSSDMLEGRGGFFGPGAPGVAGAAGPVRGLPEATRPGAGRGAVHATRRANPGRGTTFLPARVRVS